MKINYISIIVGVVLIVLVGTLVKVNKKPANLTNEVVNGIVATSTDVTGTGEIPTLPPTMSLSFVANHNSRSSCWSAINGGVYDLTSWIPNHPGGERAILSLCGIDGSNFYNGQHGGSSKILKILSGFRISNLSK